ncbi:MAG: UDP-N-acetylglucosamine 2-epimerase (non-hydrolyzing) [Hydrogenophaga sp.]|jgi:UDP-N-acetylglucosamine 2-epimerase (non-hydrolysing)|uniref:non-hydrolyzing UDP-N-acetylglucosamine 2-epimerase n=1 Tax=Hydrogenophaga sp. TaxID=1904254 RepID=UPI00271EBCFD|nr:UDP-N-acetylglucosamine 2-epimerase (non-hydrolyzing) [Hydrogenophaga sp.]MDO9149546.1 UDP-N-acetylglucosamine 2-epimerase (non-hydrolyzing) [Hydrogenophaga sp.]MDP2407167.1 UDP-N-acetylglucosamine 2-epimerase (non-hydrolyzing) [Hydrogenophaga sp.]MDZ4175902.1 UDP-N-acetylglucosamine 2-epimerase (non-hydrolyzing) [Hydrogenophaga sp.]
MKVLVIVGTRPEAIKMVPVYNALKACSWCNPRLLLTGQHREMARSVLDVFNVTPDLDLDVMEPSQTLLSLSTRLTQSLVEVIGAERPDAILVQGDTTSAMIAGWLGFYAGCLVGHIEAGLRTGNLATPFPEEFNRRVVALTAHWHFAPTEEAAANLRAEGLTQNVHVVGNTVIDAALEIAKMRTPRMQALSEKLNFLGQPGRRVVLVTTHRRENLGEPMRGIAAAVADLAEAHPKVDFLVPVHPNPVCGAALRPVLKGRANVYLTAPLEYDEMIYVLRHAFLVLTDSGGIQEEAPAFDVPVLVLRNETERMEGVEAGCSSLVGTDRHEIVRAANRLFTNPALYAAMSQARNPYGDGSSAQQIAVIIGAAS